MTDENTPQHGEQVSQPAPVEPEQAAPSAAEPIAPVEPAAPSYVGPPGAPTMTMPLAESVSAAPSPWPRRLGLGGIGVAIFVVSGLGGFLIGHGTADDHGRPDLHAELGPNDRMPGDGNGRGNGDRFGPGNGQRPDGQGRQFGQDPGGNQSGGSQFGSSSDGAQS